MYHAGHDMTQPFLSISDARRHLIVALNVSFNCKIMILLAFRGASTLSRLRLHFGVDLSQFWRVRVDLRVVIYSMLLYATRICHPY